MSTNELIMGISKESSILRQMGFENSTTSGWMWKFQFQTFLTKELYFPKFSQIQMRVTKPMGWSNSMDFVVPNKLKRNHLKFHKVSHWTPEKVKSILQSIQASLSNDRSTTNGIEVNAIWLSGDAAADEGRRAETSKYTRDYERNNRRKERQENLLGCNVFGEHVILVE